MSDADTVEVAKMVLVGKVNKDIVLRLGRHGQRAVGLCGDDGLLFRVARQASPEGTRHRPGRDASSASTSTCSTTSPRTTSRWWPSVGADREGHSHNVNADEAAGAVAAALRAYKVIYLTDVQGWLRDPADPASLVTQTRVDELLAALDGVSGGMRPKLAACAAAIQGGVSFAHIVDGRVSHSLLLELFTDAGIGTKVLPAGTPA